MSRGVGYYYGMSDKELLPGTPDVTDMTVVDLVSMTYRVGFGMYPGVGTAEGTSFDKVGDSGAAVGRSAVQADRLEAVGTSAEGTVSLDDYKHCWYSQ